MNLKIQYTVSILFCMLHLSSHTMQHNNRCAIPRGTGHVLPEIRSKALDITNSIDRHIEDGKLSDENAICKNLEQQWNSGSDERTRKRIAGLCVVMYRDTLLKGLPLQHGFDKDLRFYVNWQQGNPEKIYMVTEQNPRTVSVWHHENNVWTKDNPHILQDDDNDKRINFVQTMGDMLALGVCVNNDSHTAWLRIYEKDNAAANSGNQSTWKKIEKIRIIGGRLISCAMTPDKQQCAVLLNMYGPMLKNRKTLRVFRRNRSDAPIIKHNYIDNVDCDTKEIIELTQASATLRSDKRLFRLVFNGNKAVAHTINSQEQPMYENRSISRLIAHALYQNHSKNQSSASAPSTAIPESVSNDKKDTAASSIIPPVIQPIIEEQQQTQSASSSSQEANPILSNIGKPEQDTVSISSDSPVYRQVAAMIEMLDDDEDGYQD